MRRVAFLVVLFWVLSCSDSAPELRNSAAFVPHEAGQELPSALPGENPVTIIQESLRLEKAEEYDKAVILEEMAFARMRQSPTDVPAVWQLLKTQEERFADTPASYASRLNAFMGEVRGALSECRNLADFSIVWNVLKQVELAENQAHDSLYEIGLAELEQASRGVASPSTLITDDIKALVSMRSPSSSGESGQTLAFILSSSLAARDEDGASADGPQSTGEIHAQFYGAVADLLARVLEKIDAFLVSELEKLTQEAEKDKKGEVVDPTPVAFKGTYQQAMEAFERLYTEIEVTDLASWPLIAQADFLEQIQSIEARLGELAWKASELQRLRYNVWALRQMQLAAGTQTWPDIIGPIDLDNLDPSVSSLYSLTYDDLIRNETDPQDRDACVRILLSTDKVTLEQF